MTKKLINNWFAITALALGLMAGQQSAHATVLDTTDNGTIFEFGTLDWSADFTGSAPNTGTIVYNDPVGEVTINGSSNGLGAQSETGISTTATEAGAVNFSWLYQTFDVAPTWDVFYWINDGDGTATSQLSLDSGSASQSGSESFLVAAGDIFGFSIITVDNEFLPSDFASVTISGFSFEALGAIGGVSKVPVPPAFLLFGSALAGFGLLRLKKGTA